MSRFTSAALATFLLASIGLSGRVETQAPSGAAGVPNLASVWTRSGRSSTPEKLPLNARAIALREAIDESIAGMYDCVPATTPHILGDPYNFSIEQQRDRVLIKFEKDAITRTVWLDGHGHRSATAADFALQGFSTGRYEKDQLVVETTRFTFDPGGLEDHAPMVPSSTQKRTVERYSRSGDTLTVDVVLEDSLMLTGPVSYKFLFKPTKDALVEWPECDPEQARAPLNYMPVNQLKYGIR